jgi:hypothetical protein
MDQAAGKFYCHTRKCKQLLEQIHSKYFRNKENFKKNPWIVMTYENYGMRIRQIQLLPSQCGSDSVRYSMYHKI